MQKRLLTVEEVTQIFKTTAESFPKRIRLEKGAVCEELIDIFTVYKAWRAIERLDLGD